MDFLQYLLVLLASSSGLFAGVIVAMFAKEELKAGQRWFLALEDIVLAALLVSVWSSRLFNTVVLVTISIVTLLLLVHPAYALRHLKPLGRLRNSVVPSILFALILSTAQDSPWLGIFSPIVFLFGIPAGTRWYATTRNWYAHIALKMFVLVGFGLVFWYLQ